MTGYSIYSDNHIRKRKLGIVAIEAISKVDRELEKKSENNKMCEQEDGNIVNMSFRIT